MGNELPSLERLYTEICSDIRATDEISFKLIGFVPLVSGAAFLAVFFKEDLADKPAIVVTLALFAALITLGLFRWELRNIQNCSWLRRRAEALERDGAIKDIVRPSPPLRIGKTEAEKSIYSITILAWLAIPPVFSCLNKAPTFRMAYVILAVAIVFLTSLSVFVPIRVKTIGSSSTRQDAYYC